MKNKKILISAIFVFIIAIVFFVVFFSLPSNYKNKITIQQHTINAFNTNTNIAKIVVFSDLNLLYNYNVDNLPKLIATINHTNPDIVIFNGDLFKDNLYKKDQARNDKIISELKKIEPVYGKFAVLGEQDLKNKDVSEILFNSDFEVLTNAKRNIRINGRTFNIIGLIDNNKEKNILNELSDQSYNIVITHNPSIIDKIKDYKIDIIVTGHTLGGQYNLPIYGSIFEDIRKIPYYKGYHEVNGIKVFNSNGIGIYQSSMRFRAPSSIEEFTIK